MKLNKRAQTIMEYAVLVIVILGVFITMQMYIKRGFQGRWKAAVDDFGEQYDPREVNSIINHTMVMSANTTILTIPSAGGYYTNRIDTSQTSERKTGYITVGDFVYSNTGF